MTKLADVMELVDMRDLGSRVERRGGSSPFIRTMKISSPDKILSGLDIFMVREGGFEPPRPCEHWHLKPASLPIPPLAHKSAWIIVHPIKENVNI